MNFLMCVRTAERRATFRARRPMACLARLRAWREFANEKRSVSKGVAIILIFVRFVNNHWNDCAPVNTVKVI